MVIRVSQAMGYLMEGCEKDVESNIGKQGEDVVDSLGNSGGILCIWEETVFKKDHITISDSFVAIYGTRVPNKAKILIVAIYAPQDPKYRRVLWDYISILLSRWNGEVILMGDFNEVRNKDERRGSWFNSYNSRLFDNFISSSGLVDVKMEGYTFTWSHPSAKKISKLDRFLVSDGVISLFPSITALCLDRHLSDHRPIILSEVKLDFGPVPFCLYHSWFSYVGFNDMVEQTWRSFSYSDSNGLKLNFSFPNRLSYEQAADLERGVSRDEIRSAVRDCGENKSPGPDGAVNEGLFKGIHLQGSLFFSHLFYADDALFIGEWSDANLRGIIHILKCFFLASGLQININKSKVLGVGVPRVTVEAMAVSIGCSIIQQKFCYLGVLVGECMYRHKAWDDVVLKLRSRLSKWKAKTLSIGGRLTLLKSVIGASPFYTMSIFKVPKGVLKISERRSGATAVYRSIFDH
nr:RNA-directed DNA polymerase, eukaryota [Tanacetum cinerariifolium]